MLKDNNYKTNSNADEISYLVKWTIEVNKILVYYQIHVITAMAFLKIDLINPYDMVYSLLTYLIVSAYGVLYSWLFVIFILLVNIIAVDLTIIGGIGNLLWKYAWLHTIFSLFYILLQILIEKYTGTKTETKLKDSRNCKIKLQNSKTASEIQQPKKPKIILLQKNHNAELQKSHILRPDIEKKLLDIKIRKIELKRKERELLEQPRDIDSELLDIEVCKFKLRERENELLQKIEPQKLPPVEDGELTLQNKCQGLYEQLKELKVLAVEQHKELLKIRDREEQKFLLREVKRKKRMTK